MSNSFLKPVAVALMLAVAPLSISNVQAAAVKVGSYVGIWIATTSYVAGDLVTYNNKTFLSLVATNKNKNPDKTPTAWQLLGGVGAMGLQGAIGLTGATGAQGVKGDTGLTGSQGLQGIQGDTGIQGSVGAAGLPQAGENVGDMQYWDGTQWQVVPAIQPDPNITPTLAMCEGVPTWVLYYCPGTSPYSIGETGPAGGKVFYVTDNGLHGLEAAPVDHPLGVNWGCGGGIFVPNAQDTSLGAGASNTAAIVTACYQYLDTPAKIANDYVLNGYSDWYLPSFGELQILYSQRDILGGFADSKYWSSTISGSGMYVYFGNASNPDWVDLTGIHQVRPIRTF